MARVTDWSQSGEQALILEWAERHGPGRWLDIGAADGVTASNTRALALAGWSGVAIEPAATQFQSLANLYSDRDDVLCVQAALVVERQPLLRFHMSADLVSTSVDAYRDKWASLVDFNSVYVASVTVEELLAVVGGPFDLISIDVEGGTLALWDELRRLDAFAPNAMAVVEAEDGNERWIVQQAAHEGWARVGVTPNNVICERI